MKVFKGEKSVCESSKAQRLRPLIYYGRGMKGKRDIGMLGDGERGTEVMGCLGGCRREKTVMEGEKEE